MMMMALRQEIGSPRRGPGLVIDDLANIRKRYSQTDKKTGKANWAVACGGAAKFLLDANSVRGREFKNPEVTDKRRHKDLEIYLFNDNVLKTSKNPLDLYYVEFWGPLKEVDYSQETIPAGFYVETLRGYYFGFQLPTEKDVVQLSIGNKVPYNGLSPEFVIASKLFHTRPTREEDEEDSLNLLEKFCIDNQRLSELIKSTKFRDVVREDEIRHLDEFLLSGDYHEKLSERIRELYSESGLDVENMDFNCLVTLLDYKPESFRDINEEQIDYFIRNSHSSSKDQAETRLNLRYLLQNFSPRRVQNNLENMNHGIVKHLLSRSAVGLSSELNQVLTKFRDTATRIGISENEIGYGTQMIAENILGREHLNQWVNVQLARYAVELDKINHSKNMKKEFDKFVKREILR